MISNRTQIARVFIIASCLLFITSAAQAETRIMLLLDASGTMASPGAPGTSHTKFDEVRAAVNTMLQGLPADVAVGLRVMGGSPAADCYTTYLHFVPSTGMRSYFQDSMDTVRPAGTRALYQGIEESVADLGGTPRGTDTVLLVVTDGGDDCGRDFTDLARTYSYVSEIPRIVVYGLDLTATDREELGELASETGGRVINLDSAADLAQSLEEFSQEFAHNLRIHLQDTEGAAVSGDVVVRDVNSGTIIAERLDITDLSITVEPGRYEVIGRYLGLEVRTEELTIGAGDSETIPLEFSVYREQFTLTLRDLFGQPLRARITFVNSSNEPVLTTDVEAIHRVELPPDTYTVQIRFGDYTQDVGGVQVGPAYDRSFEIELPVELGILEVEVSNVYGFPLNAKVSIYDMDGTMLDEGPSTSYLYSRLPPGEYRITAEFEEILVEEIVYLYSGEQREVGLQIDVALGDLFIMLRTESGNDAWGWVRVYDSQGNLLERFDRERVESPDWFVTDLPVGMYRIEAEAEGIVRIVSAVEVRENEETEVLIEFPVEVY